MPENKNKQLEKQLTDLNFSDQGRAVVNNVTALIEKEQEYDKQLQQLKDKENQLSQIINNYEEKEKTHQTEIDQLKKEIKELGKKKWWEARKKNLTTGFLAFGNSIENIPGAGPFLKTGTQKFGQWVFARDAQFIDYFLFGSIYVTGFVSPYAFKLGKIAFKLGAKLLKFKTAGLVDIEQIHHEINQNKPHSINQAQPGGNSVIINIPQPQGGYLPPQMPPIAPPTPPQLPPIDQPQTTQPRPRNKRGQFIKQKK
jgi:hypothetical protein